MPNTAASSSGSIPLKACLPGAALNPMRGNGESLGLDHHFWRSVAYCANI